MKNNFIFHGVPPVEIKILKNRENPTEKIIINSVLPAIAAPCIKGS